MQDLEKTAPDDVWCGGDLAWLGPWAAECIDRGREAGWKTVMGHTDVWTTGDPQTIVCNTGAVGLPMDGPFASYLLVDQSGADWTLTHRRIEFDRRGALAQSKHQGGPESKTFIDLLETGGRS